MVPRSLKRISRSVAPIGAPHATQPDNRDKKGMIGEAKDAFFQGTTAVDWWQNALEFVHLNWDWIGAALVLFACAIAGWAIYRALNGGWRDEI